MRLGLGKEVSEGSGISVGKKIGQLGRILVQRTADVIQMVEGTMTLDEAVVREALAAKIAPDKAAGLPTSENRGGLLAQEGFLAVDRDEWSADGKNFINGLFRMLHTDGSHLGLSDQDNATFRLHIVLVSARTFPRRYDNGN